MRGEVHHLLDLWQGIQGPVLWLGHEDLAAREALRCHAFLTEDPVEARTVVVWCLAPGRVLAEAERVVLRERAAGCPASTRIWITPWPGGAEAGSVVHPALGLAVRVEGTPSTRVIARENPQVSAVVVTGGGRAPLLREALESILSGVERPFELLLIEDGKSEETAAVARSYGTLVQYHPTPQRRGQAAAMNHALSLVRGSHVAWLDDDDRWAPMKLARQGERLRVDPTPRILGTRHVIQDARGRTLAIPPPPSIDRVPALRLLLHGSLLTGPSAVVPIALYRRVGEYDTSFTRLADHDFWVRAAEVAPIEVLPEPLTWVRRHAGNQRGGSVEERIRDAAARIHRHLRALPLERLFPELAVPGASADRRALALEERAAAALRAGLAAEAEEDLREAIDATGPGSDAVWPLAALLLEERRLDQAEVLLQAAAAARPRDARAWLGLGSVSFHRQRWQEAEERFGRALELDPTHPVTRASLLVHRFDVPGLASPLQAEVEALVRDLLLRLRPADLGLGLFDEGAGAIQRPIAF